MGSGDRRGALHWRRLDVTNVAYSPDGELLVAAGWGGTATIIDRAGHVISVLQ